MNSESLQTSFWLMVLIQTIGSVDMPGKGPRKMPSPRQYVAIFVTWFILQVVSGIGAQAERVAAALGWLLVLVGMVVGPFGSTFTGFLQSVAKNFAISPPTSSVSPSSTSTPTQAQGVLV